jgi:hypothetical protein
LQRVQTHHSISRNILQSQHVTSVKCKGQFFTAFPGGRFVKHYPVHAQPSQTAAPTIAKIDGGVPTPSKSIGQGGIITIAVSPSKPKIINIANTTVAAALDSTVTHVSVPYRVEIPAVGLHFRH